MKSNVTNLLLVLATIVMLVVSFLLLGTYGALAIILLIVASLNQAERVNE